MLTRTLAFTLIASLSLALSARAGDVRPFDLPEAPTLVLAPGDVYQGSPVPVQRQVWGEYPGTGLNISTVAIGTINGTAVWLPVGTPAVGGSMWGSDTDYADKLNFTPGYNAVISGGFVMPGTTHLATVTQFSAEIIGGEPGVMPIIELWYENLPIPHTPWINLPTDPFSPTPEPGRIQGFSIYMPWSDENTDWEKRTPWGVASVSFDTPMGYMEIPMPLPVESTVATPEPASLSLAVLGLAGVGLRYRRRRA